MHYSDRLRTGELRTTAARAAILLFIISVSRPALQLIHFHFLTVLRSPCPWISLHDGIVKKISYLHWPSRLRLCAYIPPLPLRNFTDRWAYVSTYAGEISREFLPFNLNSTIFALTLCQEICMYHVSDITLDKNFTHLVKIVCLLE